jgi:hypothetical protein
MCIRLQPASDALKGHHAKAQTSEMVCIGNRFSANLLCRPTGLIFAQFMTQGFGRCASSPWAVLSRAFSAHDDVCDQTLWQSFYYAGITTQQNASAPASYSGSAESAGQNSPGWSEAEPWVQNADPRKP